MSNSNYKDSKKDIHIHMQNGVVPTEEGSKSIEEFVIWQNKKLSEGVDKLSEEIQELISERDELRRENDKYASSVRYSKGILKNFVELRNYESDLKNEYRTLYNNNILEMKKIIQRVVVFMCFISWGCFFPIYFMYNYEYIEYSFSLYMIFFCMFGIIGPITRVDNFIESKFSKLFVIPVVCKDRIKCIEEKIKKLNSSQDFINEYIENI